MLNELDCLVNWFLANTTVTKTCELPSEEREEQKTMGCGKLGERKVRIPNGLD